MKKVVSGLFALLISSSSFAQGINNPQTNASQLTTGTLPSGRLSGIYSGITGVGASFAIGAGSALTSSGAGGALAKGAFNTTAITVSTYTSGTNTSISTPAGAIWAEAWLTGGGGAGAGSGTAPGTPGAGNNSCFNTSSPACTSPVIQSGGGAAGTLGNGASSAGGTVSGSGTCQDPHSGQAGGGGAAVITAGSSGGNSPFISGGGPAGYGIAGATTPGAGVDAVANSGGGGGGAGDNATAGPGGGGAGGAGCHFFLASLVSSYFVTIGGSVAGGTAGTAGAAGGAGSAGYLIIVWHYNY